MSAEERYDELVAAFPDVPRKGKANPYTSLNGYMFSFIDKAGLLHFRLPKARIAELIAQGLAEHAFQYGRNMPDFAQMSDEVFRDLEAAKAIFAESLGHTASLKPKATKKAGKK